MKILLLMHFVPYPPTSGALQRNYNLLKEISQRYDVHLVCLTQKALLPDETKLNDSIKHVSPFCKTIKVFPIPSDASPLQWYFLLLCNLFSALPYSVKRFYSKAMLAEINSILHKNAIDIIHVDTIDLAQYISPTISIPKVLNHHNIESALLLRRAANAKSPLTSLYARMQAHRLEKYEKKMVQKFDTNLTVSEIDKLGFEQLCPHAKFSIVPNGTDTEYFSESDSVQEPIMIFAGGLNWYPNKDAMVYFCTKILPLVVKTCPQARLQIIGQDPPREFNGFKEKGLPVDVIGFVPDIRVYYSRAAVQIVPLRVGGGTRLKILDALAMGKAVVSTSIGVEGLDLIDGKDLLIADNEESFAQKVVMLLTNSESRKRLGKTGRATVEKKYGWDVIGPQLLSIYSDVQSDQLKRRT